MFLLLLCDTGGPRALTNRRGTNVFAFAVVALLISMSRAERLGGTPRHHRPAIIHIVLGCTAVAVAAGGWTVPVAAGAQLGRGGPPRPGDVADAAAQHAVQTAMSAGRKVAGRHGSYMMIAMVMAIVRIVQMALAH